MPPWPIEAFREWRKPEVIADCDVIAGNAKSASDAMHSTVVRELGLRPWEYGWNRDTYVVGLLTRAAGGGLKHRGASLHFICGSASF